MTVARQAWENSGSIYQRRRGLGRSRHMTDKLLR